MHFFLVLYALFPFPMRGEDAHAYRLLPSLSYHDPYEPEYDDVFEEPNDEPVDGEGGEAETRIQNSFSGHSYIDSGDPAAAAAAKSKDTKEFDKLAVPKDQRTTTPYMTKYERARLLGTRALQIR